MTEIVLVIVTQTSNHPPRVLLVNYSLFTFRILFVHLYIHQAYYYLTRRVQTAQWTALSPCIPVKPRIRPRKQRNSSDLPPVRGPESQIALLVSDHSACPEQHTGKKKLGSYE